MVVVVSIHLSFYSKKCRWWCCIMLHQYSKTLIFNNALHPQVPWWHPQVPWWHPQVPWWHPQVPWWPQKKPDDTSQTLCGNVVHWLLLQNPRSPNVLKACKRYEDLPNWANTIAKENIRCSPQKLYFCVKRHGSTETKMVSTPFVYYFFGKWEYSLMLLIVDILEIFRRTKTSRHLRHAESSFSCWAQSFTWWIHNIPHIQAHWNVMVTGPMPWKTTSRKPRRTDSGHVSKLYQGHIFGCFQE